MRLLTFKECAQNPNKIVGLRFDRVFKEVFGKEENKDLTIYLLSVLMDIDYNEVSLYIKMLPERFEMDSITQKRRDRDLAVALIKDKTTQINIELNIHEYDQILQDRNMLYVAQFVSHSIDTGQNYKEIKDTIQYNLNSYYSDKENKNLIDTYYVKNENGIEFTKILKIVCWNIYKMNKIWYSGSIEEYDQKTRNKIILGALIMMDDRTDFLKCVKMLDAKDEIKEKIERIVIELNENANELWTRYYDPEEEAEKIKATWESIGIEKGMQKGQEAERKKTICSMKEHNIDIPQIATIMNLNQQEVYKYLQM